MNTSDQKLHWNKLHKQNVLKAYSDNPTDFAIEAAKLFPGNATVLELGCGLGNDSAYFAKNDHNVIGTDFSDEVIKQNKYRYKNIEKLQFQVFDMSKMPYPFRNNNFDVVYTRLSLHYFDDKTTRNMINEINRLLEQDGLLFYLCKSNKDPLYGKGKKIEKDMFELNRHVRHFFSEDYSRDLLKDKFKILKLESGTEDFYGEKSGYIKVVAKKLT